MDTLMEMLGGEHPVTRVVVEMTVTRVVEMTKTLVGAGVETQVRGEEAGIHGAGMPLSGGGALPSSLRQSAKSSWVEVAGRGIEIMLIIITRLRALITTRV